MKNNKDKIEEATELDELEYQSKWIRNIYDEIHTIKNILMFFLIVSIILFITYIFSFMSFLVQ